MTANRTFVIAEVAATHDGNLQKALRLVDLARAIRADAVKFQWVSDPERLVARRHAPGYLAAYQLLSFPREWFPVLVERCSSRHLSFDSTVEEPPVEFMCTAYLPEDIPVVAPYVSRFKVASFEAGDREFVCRHLAYGKPVVISTGMMAEDALRGLFADVLTMRRKYGQPPVYYLHCVSSYPAPADEMNLGAVRRYCLHGLSDHSRIPWMGAMAVAVGAQIVEFHVRLDDTDPGNADYAVAFPPSEAAQYAWNVRVAERLFGDGVKRVMSCEEIMLRYRVRAGGGSGGG